MKKVQEQKFKRVLSFVIGDTRTGNLSTRRVSLGISSDFLPPTRILHGQESTEIKTLLLTGLKVLLKFCCTDRVSLSSV